jgi:hypothetical protein
MTEKIIPPDFQEADSLLADLFEDILYIREESRIGGNANYWSDQIESSEPKFIGAEAVKNLLETRVEFGNPENLLTHLTQDIFGTDLNIVYQQQMADRYDFYYMTISVALIPKPATRFWRLTCNLEFASQDHLIVQSIFPTNKWRSVLNFGVGMDAGIDGNLEWSAGVESSQLANFIALLPEGVKAKAVSKNQFKGFIAIPAFKYELGNPEILAAGEGHSFCYWRIQDQELQKIGTANFAIVFKVAKGTETISLQGTVWAEPDINWLTADIKDVFAELADGFKKLLQQRNDAASKFARGAVKKWTLTLPKPKRV